MNFYYCESCNYSFETKSQLFLHIKQKHKQKYRQSVEEKNSSNQFYKDIFCELNHVLSATEHPSFELNEIIEPDSSNLIACIVCNKKCKGNRGIAAHMRAAHPNEWANQKLANDKLKSKEEVEREKFKISFTNITYEMAKEIPSVEKSTIEYLTNDLSFAFDQSKIGPTDKVPKDASAADIFCLLWGSIWNTVLIGINEAIIRSHPSLPDFKFHDDMLKGWIAVWIFTQLNPKRNIAHFWNAENSFVRKMSMKLWMSIYSGLLHLDEKLLDYMETILNQQFIKFWIPSQEVSIDEILRKFKGRCRHKQYDPSKPAKRGLYWYAMVDKNNYLIRFTMRKSGVHVNLLQLCKDYLLTLAEYVPFVGSFILFCDNMYGSFDLASFCSMLGFGYVFTMRLSRLSWFWDWVHSLMKSTPIGDWVLLKSKDGQYITSWQDNGKKPTNFVSNIQCNPFKETVRKYKGGKRQIIVPEISILYNSGMGFVDSFGQALSAPMKNEYHHWWKRKVFLLILQMTILNARVIFQKLHNKEISIYDFYEMLQNELILSWIKHKENEKQKSKEQSQKKRRAYLQEYMKNYRKKQKIK
ncbi:MAG TPA: hypothetical protein VKZ44_00610 [Taishania sp.]|nr:hypothetical protein [Taishania sp.]